MTHIEPLLYKSTDVAMRLQVSVVTVARLISSGELASIKIGRSRLIAPEALDDFLARRRAATDDS